MILLAWDWYNRYPTEENKQNLLMELERYKNEGKIPIETYRIVLEALNV